MESLSRNVWKSLSRLFPADGEASSKAAALFREYESSGFLRRASAELVSLDLPVIADFFRRVSLMHSSESPVLRRRDTRWMSEIDYTFFNIRAAGVNGKTGNFLNAAMLLTTLRTSAVILAPVTAGPSEDLTVLESHAVIRETLAEENAVNAGIGPEKQMLAFAEAAHFLKLSLGFSLDYRVDPLAAVVLNRPELFFWTKDGEFIPEEQVQDELREEVRARVASVRKTGITPTRELFASSLDVVNLSPLLSSDGSGRTPLALKKILPGKNPGPPRESAATYWGRIFDLWRDRYGFDFLVLYGTEQPETESFEIPDMALIRTAAEAARKSGVRKNIGVAAEGNRFNVEMYGINGVDLVLEEESGEKAGVEWFTEVFELNDYLRKINLGRKLKFSVPVAISPGDKESNPRRERALIKRFTARFFTCGPSRRPVLETMGACEGAWGFADSLKHSRTMGWMPDPDYFKTCHNLDDVFLMYKDVLANGEIVSRELTDRFAWWIVNSRKGVLVCIVSVENEDLLPPGNVYIDVKPFLKENTVPTVLEYDFRENRGILLLSMDTVIRAESIPYRGFRLFSVT